MGSKAFHMEDIDITWCPGWGSFAIPNTLKQALAELQIEPENIGIVSGIGEAAKKPHYLKCNVFHGLHGRVLPVATGINAVNPELTVIAEGGDGDMYAQVRKPFYARNT